MGDSKTIKAVFKQGKVIGKAVIKYENGDEYTGEVDSDYRRNGEGEMKVDGGTYRGQFLKERMHGRGVFKWDNGDEYSGDFIDGNRDGTGTFLYHNGDSYTGKHLITAL